MRKIDKLSPMRLKVIEFQRYLSGGVTRPLLVVAVDEYGQMHTIVLKLRHPDSETGHFEETSLACELVCSVIARSLDLPVPDYAIVEVPRAFPQNVEAESARKLLQRNIGSNFGQVSFAT